MINRAASGDFGPLVDALEPTGGPSSALGLYLSVTCAEGTARISLEEARRAAMGTFLGAYRAEAQIAACAEWPQAELPEAFFRPVRSDVPTLLLVGEVDVITPPAWSDQVAATLNHARVIRLPHAGHLLWSTGPEGAAGRCADELTAQFYHTVDVATLDTDCVQAVPEPPFFVSN
jgi:pimeloyl-ACP methyl ester carboxylesterase